MYPAIRPATLVSFFASNDFNLSSCGPMRCEAALCFRQQSCKRVERLVNQWIAEEHALEVKEVPIAEAKAAGQQNLWFTMFPG